MSLTAADVAEIMRLVEQSSFDELTLELDGLKLSFRRGTAMTQDAATTRGTALAGGPAAVVTGTQHSETPAAPEVGFKHIESPMLGTFYRCPKPGVAPFVEIGSEVVEETVIAIIEVMKLMNTVRAGVRGTVTDIFPADGTLVEYGALLMRVRASG